MKQIRGALGKHEEVGGENSRSCIDKTTLSIENCPPLATEALQGIIAIEWNELSYTPPPFSTTSSLHSPPLR